jgi:tRNA (guanine26-N2/guanine27-N2)-dimethyltransferase
MALERDLSVAVVRARREEVGRPLRAWEMLSATGARGLRLLLESDALAALVVSEIEPAALRLLSENVRRLDPAGRATVRAGDARRGVPDGPFDLVDVDPFGTPVPFVDAAIAATAPGGLLAVTATDLPVLAGVQRAACRARYGATPVHGHFGPEAGLRILVAYLLGRAEAAGRSARPRLAYVLGHHLRVYLELDRPPSHGECGVLPAPGYLGPDLGPGGPFGPLWTGPILDPELVGRLRAPATAAEPGRVAALIERFREESRVEEPFYYEPNRLAESEGLDRPPSLASLFGEIERRGFRAARTHVRPSGFRTTAPREAVYAAARAAGGREGPPA